MRPITMQERRRSRATNPQALRPAYTGGRTYCREHVIRDVPRPPRCPAQMPVEIYTRTVHSRAVLRMSRLGVSRDAVYNSL